MVYLPTPDYDAMHRNHLSVYTEERDRKKDIWWAGIHICNAPTRSEFWVFYKFKFIMLM